jgi:hypothetical protein
MQSTQERSMKSINLRKRGTRAVLSPAPRLKRFLLRCLRLATISLMLFGLPTCAHADITSNLLLWYRFDESSGTSAADASGNSSTSRPRPTFCPVRRPERTAACQLSTVRTSSLVRPAEGWTLVPPVTAQAAALSVVLRSLESPPQNY